MESIRFQRGAAELLSRHDALEQVDAWTVIGHKFLKRDDQTANVPRRADFAQRLEPDSHVFFRESIADKDSNLVVLRRHRVLKQSAEFLREFFARSHARKFDFDIFFGPEPRQENQVPGEIDNLHGLAHVENANLSALTDGQSLQHKLAGLGNSHKEAAHFGMRDSDGASGRDLLLENRNDAAV